jgi:predicted SprT family Zn-dependent metalloprotease
MNTALKKFFNKNPSYKFLKKRLESVTIQIKVSSRLTSVWAYVQWNDTIYFDDLDDFLIVLNKNLFTVQHGIKMRREVITHEIAHCLNILTYNSSYHDKTWKMFHEQLGGQGTTLIDARNFS